MALDDRTVSLHDVFSPELFAEAEYERRFAPKDEGCTFSRGAMRRQRVFACLKCQQTASRLAEKDVTFGMCYGCSMRCHLDCQMAGSAESAVIELFEKSNFRCDCGTPRSRGGISFDMLPVHAGVVSCCTFALTTEEHAERLADTEANRYNHNFLGKYCTCDGAYDDRSDEPMYQCVQCEDWFHGTCVGQEAVAVNEKPLLPSDHEDARCDFLCGSCTSALNPVLCRYPHLRYHLGEPGGRRPGHASEILHVPHHQQFWFLPQLPSSLHQLDCDTSVAATDDGHIPYLDYDQVLGRGHSKKLRLVHVFVPVSMRGGGLGERVGRAALRWILSYNRTQDSLGRPEQAYTVELLCPFMKKKFLTDSELAPLWGSTRICTEGLMSELKAASWWHRGQWRQKLVQCVCNECQLLRSQVGITTEFAEKEDHTVMSEDDSSDDIEAQGDRLEQDMFGRLCRTAGERETELRQAMASFPSALKAFISDLITKRPASSEPIVITKEDIQAFLESLNQMPAEKRSRHD